MLSGILSTLRTLLAVITNRHCRNFAAPTQPFGRNVEPSIHAAIWSTSFVNWKLLTSWHVGSTDALGPDLIRAKYELSWGEVQCKVIQTGRAINYVYTEVCGHSWTFSNSSDPTQTLFDAIRKFHPHRAVHPYATLTSSRDVNCSLIQWDLHFPSYLWLISSNHLHELLLSVHNP